MGSRQFLYPMKGGIKWLLRDEFTDTRAAGSVNGTPATPGPGTRAVVDIGGNISAGAGVLNVAGGSSNWGQTIYRLDGQARVAGRLLVVQATPAATTTLRLVGWFDAAGCDFGDIEHVLRFSSGAIMLLYLGDPNTPAPGNVGTYASAAVYYIAHVLRAAGAYTFIKGGTFTNWRLLYFTSVGNSATLYPAITSYNGALTADFLRVPDALWLPTPLAYDTFTRANGAIGVSEILGPDGYAVTARTYTAQVGTWQVSGNTVVATAAGIVTLPALNADVVLRCTLTTPGAGVTPAGIVVRWLDANNYWYVRVTPGTAGNDLELVEINAGAPTVRGAADKDPAAATAYTITVIASGQTIDVFWDSNREIHYTTAALNETQAIYGLRDEGNSNFVFDNLIVFPRGTGGEYAALDTWSG